jgi:Icc protein
MFTTLAYQGFFENLMKPMLTFIHITDTHLGPQRDFHLHGLNAARHLERLVTLINELREPPDFAVHTGDLANDRRAESYAIAQDILAALQVPVYLVNGNHDDRALLRATLDAPLHPSGDPAAPLDYTFEVKGERFLVIDGHSDAVPDPLGQLSPEQLVWLRDEAQRSSAPLTVFLHYPPFPIGSLWFDENMPLVNGEALHAVLCTVRDRLRGVFFGHAHHSYQIERDGITYTCAASGLMQYAWRPWDERPQVDLDSPPAYNVVRYFPDQVVVQGYTFPRP